MKASNKRFICFYWTFRDSGVHREYVDYLDGVRDIDPLADLMTGYEIHKLFKKNEKFSESRPQIIVSPNSKMKIGEASTLSREIRFQRDIARIVAEDYGADEEQIIEYAFEEIGFVSSDGPKKLLEEALEKYRKLIETRDEWTDSTAYQVYFIYPPDFSWGRKYGFKYNRYFFENYDIKWMLEKFAKKYPSLSKNPKLENEPHKKEYDEVAILKLSNFYGYEDSFDNLAYEVKEFSRRLQNIYQHQRLRDKWDEQHKKYNANQLRSQTQAKNHAEGKHPGFRSCDQKMGHLFAAKKKRKLAIRLKNKVNEIIEEVGTRPTWQKMADIIMEGNFLDEDGKPLKVTAGMLRKRQCLGQFD